MRGGGEEYQDFPSKIFCLTVPKNFVGEPFSVSLISGTEKVLIRGGGGEYQDFPSKIFCLIVPKISVGESFTVAIISGIEKFWIRWGGGGGEYHDFPSKVFVSQDRNEKLCKATLLFSENFLVSKKIMDKRGHITIFSRKFYVSQCQKLS